MSPRSGIPSVKTTHSDSSPTTQTHEEELPFSSSAPLVSWYPSFSLHFPPSHLPSVRHLYPICFFALSHLVSVFLHFSQHWTLIQARDNCKFIIASRPDVAVCLTSPLPSQTVAAASLLVAGKLLSTHANNTSTLAMHAKMLID